MVGVSAVDSELVIGLFRRTWTLKKSFVELGFIADKFKKLNRIE